MSGTTRVDVGEGKYTIVHESDGSLRAERHGMPWRELTGDKLVLAMAHCIQDLQHRLHKLYLLADDHDALVQYVKATAYIPAHHGE